MNRPGVIKRAARLRPEPTRVTITAPNEEQCGLPAHQRTCVVAREWCPAALTGHLPPGVDHPTMCALDSGGLVGLPGKEGERRNVEWRRHDCERLWGCEEAWIEHSHVGAKCPTGCIGFVRRDSGLVPLSALARARKVAS